MLGLTLQCSAAPSEKLLNAIRRVESSDGRDKRAYNTKRKCWGDYQIMQGVISDVNRVYHSKYTHIDALDKNVARRICYLYLDYYGDVFRAETGIEPTSRTYARIWNQGYSGRNRPAAKRYWEKVRTHL
jgi:hypothetical protein